jgi:hypothetical protein
MKTIMLRVDWNWTPWRCWEAYRLGNCDMLMRNENSTQRDRRMFVEASAFEKSAVGIAAIWIVFYAVIGIATMVVHGVSSVAALH